MRAAGDSGPVIHASFELDGQPFLAMDGGDRFAFTPGFSICVTCQTQAEIDRLWAALAAGGQEQAAGFVTDRYGLTWQIVPARLGELMRGGDPAAQRRVREALRAMKKYDIAALEHANAGEAPAQTKG
jgi:predicted 3-demethylubiquinone-9 3-methyltransferase (glyoxalase superfamily)